MYKVTPVIPHRVYPQTPGKRVSADSPPDSALPHPGFREFCPDFALPHPGFREFMGPGFCESMGL